MPAILPFHRVGYTRAHGCHAAIVSTECAANDELRRLSLANRHVAVCNPYGINGRAQPIDRHSAGRKNGEERRDSRRNWPNMSDHLKTSFGIVSFFPLLFPFLFLESRERSSGCVVIFTRNKECLHRGSR